MSVGNIVVELELRDGRFTQRVRSAGRTVSTLTGAVADLDRRVRRAEDGMYSMLPRLRDIAIVGASARTIVHSLSDTIGALTSTIIRSNAEIEKMNVLLMGMSSAVDTDGKLKEAANDMAFLFEKAQRAPFSINELSNSFVKMKSAGIERVSEKVTSLTNAISQFGGGDQTLHRATIAIQQMASKGVISMEELRQQLGEAVPNAMNLMADGLGMTMKDMVDAISKGRVKAIPAIEAMMEEMDKTMSGASERMMSTWDGLMSQLSTKLTLFKNEIGDAGFFDVAKESLREIVDYMSTDSATELARSIGVFMRNTVEFIATATSKIRQFSGEIATATKFALGLYASLKTITTVKSIISGVIASFASLRAAIAATAVVTETRAVTGLAGLFGATVTTTTAVTGLARATSILNVAIGALGGPIGLLIAGLASATAYWFSFGDEGEKAVNKLKKSRDALSEFERIELKIGTFDELDKAKQKIDELAAEIKKKKDDINSGNLFGLGEKLSMSSFTKDGIERKRKQLDLKRKADLIASETELSKIMKNYMDDRDALIDKEAKRRVTKTQRALKKELSQFDSFYKEKMDVARKARDKEIEIATSRDQVDAANKAFIEKSIKNSENLYNARLDLVRSKIEEYGKKIREVSNKNKDIALFISASRELKESEKAKAAVLAKISETKREIELSKESGSDTFWLEKSLKSLETQLAKSESDIDRFKKKIAELKGKNSVSSEDLIRISHFTAQLDLLNAESERLQGNIKKLSASNLSKAIINNDDIKESTKAIDTLKSAIASATDRYEGLVALNNGAPGTYADKLRSKIKRLEDQIGSVDEKTRKMIARLKELASLNETQDYIKKVNNSIKKISESTNEILVKLGQKPKNGFLDDLNKKFKDGIINQEQYISLYNKLKKAHEENSAAKAELERRKSAQKIEKKLARERVEREKFISNTLSELNDNIVSAEINGYQASAMAHQAAVDKKIADLKRLAKEKGLAGSFDDKNSQAGKFINTAYEKIVEEQRIKNANKSAIAIRAINEETQRIKIGGIKNAIEREMRLLDMEIAAKRRDYDLSIAYLEKKKALGQELNKSEIEYLNQSKLAIDALGKYRLAKIDEIKRNNKTALQSMIDDMTNVGKKMDELSAKFVDGFSDSIADFAIKGKQTFGDFAKSVIEDIGRMIIKAQTANLFKNLFGIGSEGKDPFGGGAIPFAIKNMFGEKNGVKVNAQGQAEAQNMSEIERSVSQQKSIWGDLFKFQIDGQNRVKKNSDLTIQSITEKTAQSSTTMTQMMGSFSDAVIGGFAAMAANGKLSMKSLLRTVLSAIGAMIVKYLALAAVKAIAGFSTGGTTASIQSGSQGASLGNVGSSAITPSFSSGKYKNGGIVDVTTFADGGATKIANQIANSPLMKQSDMLKGGVKKTPHVALFAEASVPEAFIPMRDGKNIPLMISRDSNGNISGSIPLPSGQILPTKIVGDNVSGADIVNKNVKAFANGGVIGATKIARSNAGFAGADKMSISIGSIVANISDDAQGAILNAIDGVRAAIESLELNEHSNVEKSTKYTDGVSDSNGAFRREFNSGSSKGGENVSIVINVSEGSKQTQSDTDPKRDVEFWSRLAEHVKKVVSYEIANEKRPGGMLS